MSDLDHPDSYPSQLGAIVFIVVAAVLGAIIDVLWRLFR